MRSAVGINLASDPFRHDRPVLVALVAGCVVLCGILAAQVALGWVESGERSIIRADIERTRGLLTQVRAQRGAVESGIREPRNAVAAEYAVFLNGLLLRKGISWTRIFDDLEQVMPYNVRLISVRPQVNLDNQILLDMTVGSEKPEPVVDLLMRLEGSSLFGAPSLTNWIPPTQSEPQYRGRVNVNYAPKL